MEHIDDIVGIDDTIGVVNGGPQNNFHIHLGGLSLDRYFTPGDGGGSNDGDAFRGSDDDEEESGAPHNDQDAPPATSQPSATKPTAAANGRPIKKHTVDSSTYVSLSPAAVAKESELVLGTLEPGHYYNSIAAPVGVPEPRPELLIHKGMNEAVKLNNQLATALVVADQTAAVYEPSRQEVLLWRRWSEIHPNPCLFGEERMKAVASDAATEEANEVPPVATDDALVEDSSTSVEVAAKAAREQHRRASGKVEPTYSIPTVPQQSIQNLKPLCLAATAGGIEHPQFIPTFQPSIMDDHFFLLGLSAAVSQDASIIQKAFASVEHLDDKGMLTIRLFTDQRVELPKIEGINGVGRGNTVASGKARGAARRKANRSLNSTMKSLNGSMSASMTGAEDAFSDAAGGPAGGVPTAGGPSSSTTSTLVTMPLYLTLDTLLPVSKATQTTISPSQLDLAVGRTYDAVNEFYVAFLAKAFATMKGTYASLNGGSAVEVLRAFVPGDGRYVRWDERIFSMPAVMDALRRVTGGGKARSIGATVDAEKIEAAAAARSGCNSAVPPTTVGADGEEIATVSAAATGTDATGGTPTAAITAPPSGNMAAAMKRVSIGGVAAVSLGASAVPLSERPASATSIASVGAPSASALRSTSSVGGANGAGTSAAAVDTPQLGPNPNGTADDDYRAVAEAALAINAARKNAEELWWLLQECTLNNQPMLMTNTNLCTDSSVDEAVCSFGNVPAPITDNLIHVETYQKFNWSFGVTVLCAVELDSSMAIADGYLRAVRRRSKRTQGDIRRLVKVRSVLRSNHPEYAKLRGEWSLPNGGGRTVASELYDEGDDTPEAAAAAALLRAHMAEEQANEKVNGGNPNWTAYAQEYLQYNVADVIEKQSEDVVWWMTIDEVCRHFNCFYTLFNTNSTSCLNPPRALVDTVTALTSKEEEERRKPRDPFQVKPQRTVKIAAGDDQFPEEPVFESSPSALLQLLRSAASEDTTTVVSDTMTQLVKMNASPSITAAYPNFPHFLLSVDKAEALDDFGRRIALPEGADIRFKSIFDVKPNPLDLGEETDDEEKSRGMGGTMTSRTGSAVDITVTPQNALQIEVRVSVPKPLAARKDFCVQLYRVTGPYKQACIRAVRDGRQVQTFPIHTKVQVRSLPPQIVTTALPNSASGGFSDTASTSSRMSTTSWSSSTSTSSVSSSDGSGGFSRCFTFECDVNTGHYNIVVMPDPDTTPSSNMYIQDASLIQLSVTKRLNGDSFNVDVSPL